ncbi:MAG: substrate-binding domain-containing protein [Spirochaetales bacterium]|nr:substrate-binding domain-containing protein [Spirochaetales bacterium]
MTLKQSRIGILIDTLDSDYQTAISNSILSAGTHLGINLLFFIGGRLKSPDEYEAQRNNLYNFVTQNNCDGLIIVAPCLKTFLNDKEFVEFIKRFSNIPMVAIGLETKNIHSILTDNSGLEELMNHFIHEHGKKHFAFVKGPESHFDAQERFNIFKKALKLNGVHLDHNLIVQGNFAYQSGEDAVRTLLDERKARVDAVIAANDYMALGVVSGLISRKIKVPWKIGVSGFDDIFISQFASPPLTSVSQPYDEIGRLAVESCLDIIRGKDVPLKQVLKTKPVIRESCGCFSERVKMFFALTESKNSKPVSPAKKEGKTEVCSRLHEFLRAKNLNLDIDDGVCELLYGAFLSDIENNEGLEFLRAINEILNTSYAGGFYQSFTSFLAYMRRNMLDLFNEIDVLHRAENLWLQALVLTNEKIEQQANMDSSREINIKANLASFFDALMVNKQSISESLEIFAKVLCEIGFNNCYITLFNEENSNRFEESRLIFALENGKTVFKNEKGITFKTRELLPKQYSMRENPSALVMDFINFSTQPVGCILFEMKPSFGYTYVELRRQIGNSLEEILLNTHVKQQQEKLESNLITLQKTIAAFIKTLEVMVEKKDPYTAGHQRRVAIIAKAIAMEMNLSEHMVESIEMAGIIHDLGKMNIPTEILNKPGKLETLEFNFIKVHPQGAYDILKQIDFPWPIADIVLQHHEKLDGSGYPKGLKGDEICLEAKIIAVADILEAMSSHRPYRAALGLEKALEEIVKNKGILYDPSVIEACFKLLDYLKEILA